MHIKKTQGNQHAVVIGASMAGLVAARVLSDHFEQVMNPRLKNGGLQAPKGVL